MTVFTQRNFVADFIKRNAIFLQKSAVLRFWDPFGDLGATYDNHLRLIEKRLLDFLLALIKLFFAMCYGWGAMSEYRFKISDFAPTGPGWPKTSGRRDRPPTILLLKKLSDRQTEFSSLDRVCIPCNSVKTLRNGRCLGWNSIMLCFRHMSTKPCDKEYIFNALHGMQMRSSDENSVCLSVKRVHCDKNGRKICPDFYTVQ